MRQIKIAIMLKTTEYRGDHRAEIFVPIELHDNETVQELSSRVFGRNSFHLVGTESKTRPIYSDVIEVRMVDDPEPVTKGGPNDNPA